MGGNFPPGVIYHGRSLPWVFFSRGVIYHGGNFLREVICRRCRVSGRCQDNIFSEKKMPASVINRHLLLSRKNNALCFWNHFGIISPPFCHNFWYNLSKLLAPFKMSHEIHGISVIISVSFRSNGTPCQGFMAAFVF